MSLDFLDRQVFSCSSALWPWAVGLLANVTLLLLGVAGAGVLLRRRSPFRHLVGSLGLCAVVVLPALNLLVSWEWGLAAVARTSWSVLPDGLSFLARPPGGAGLRRALFLVWAAGAALMVLRSAADLGLLWWHARRGAVRAPGRCSRRVAGLARRLGIRRPVEVLHSRTLDIPCTWGLRRPVILLPRSALAWSDERIKAVLLHELGHVRRRDVLFTALSRLACALYWFHPLAWWVERGAREDAERACDSLVVEQGVAPERYARHLLAIVRDARRRMPRLASAMAAESHLARRIAALVRGRPAASRLGRAAVAAALLCLVVPTVVLANVSIPGLMAVEPGQDAPDCSDPAPLEGTPQNDGEGLQSVDPVLLSRAEPL